jgi:hypothetical protein
VKDVVVQQVVVGYWREWQKWPETEDADYAELLSRRWTTEYVRGDTRLIVVSRHYPAFLAYHKTCCSLTPVNARYPGINNTILPDPRVLAQIESDLRGYAAAGCTVLYWEHAYQCFPTVMEVIAPLFKWRILSFADDAPGSSESKTFPVARFFDALYHCMYVRDLATGERVADVYHALGIPYCRFQLLGPTGGLDAALAQRHFTITDKAARIRAGDHQTDLCFVGASIASRAALLGGLGTVPGDVRARLHGRIGLRDGPLLPANDDGATLVPLYMESLFGFNVPHSSIFNTRLFDLWCCGVVQVVYDPNHELDVIGAKAFEHYLPFDGTAEELVRVVREWRARRADLAELVLRAHAFVVAAREASTWTSAHADIYFNCLDRLA